MGRFVTLDGAKTGPAVHVVDPGVPLETLIMSPNDLWSTQPSVRKVINFAARNMASVPIHAYARTGEDSRERLDRTNQLSQLLRRPAPFTTPYRFWHTIHVDGLMWDRWCFTVLESTDTEPAMFFRLPPTRYRIQKNEFGVPVRIIVWGKDSQEFHLDPKSCVFDSGYTSVWGDPVPPATSLAGLLNENDEALRYRRELFTNGARMSGVIERPREAPEWTDQAWNRFSAQFAEYKAGGGKAGGVPLLEDGMQYKQVQAHNPQSLETLELRKLTDAEVAAYFHIPPELVGSREGTFSNIDAFNQSLWSIALGPAIVAFEQALDVMLSPQIMGLDLDSVYIEAMIEAKLRGSFTEQMKAGQAAVGAPYMTRNEYRAKMNMSAIEGGDELITPLNVIAGGLASPIDTANNNAKALPAGRRAIGATKSDDDTPEWAKSLGNFDRELAAFGDRLDSHWKGWATTLAELALSDGKAETTTLFDEAQFAATATPIIRAHMQRLAEIGAWDVMALYDPKAEGWGPEMIEAWIAKAAATNASIYASGAQTAVSNALDAEDRDKAFAGLAALAVAATAAGVFANEARSFGGNDSARKSGLSTKTWHNNSKTPRPAHAALDGITVAIDDPFPNGLRYPCDSAGTAEENAHCRCSVTYGKD